MNRAEQDYPVQTSSTFFKGAFIGALVGAAAALLFAPKPGNEMRGDLSNKLSLVTDKTKEVAGVVGTKASDIAKTVSTKASDVMTTVNDSRENVMATFRKASTDVADEVASASEEIKKTEQDASSEVSQELKSNNTSY
ncbi:YtxH domain-containing protein [Paenibacillus lemnae]|uniref:YtxH domain-containing protein n=1 Tax=Paenibacillus lemnae TaxID=1330551 RepID=A0A848MAK5_PAELE|nr:YtxH domain-containing protein [Paenibacillus lemnae]NMO97289.1 YtxH domain-containing protein [Paenibacillus lemnae]